MRCSVHHLEGEEHFFLIKNITGQHPETTTPQVHGEDLSVALSEGFPSPGNLARHDLVAHVHQDRVHPREDQWRARPEPEQADQMFGGQRSGGRRSHLYTSISRYMKVRRMKAMHPVAMIKLMDQRFLLMGMRPEFKEKPERPPARMPVMRAQSSHLLTLACQSL